MALSIALALSLDWRLQEVRRWHPLVGFGNIAIRIEKALNRPAPGPVSGIVAGMAAWSLAVVPFVLVAYWLSVSLSGYSVLAVVVGGIVLYYAIGWQSLIGHAKAVTEPLKRGDLLAARKAVGMIVSRDTTGLNEEQVASAATESVLENGADAVFAAVFWFMLLGLPGVVLYRLSNTLDAMWGYKNDRYVSFGWMAARMDDLLNLVPARLTALSYAFVGDFRSAITAWRHQAGTWKSPNAGPVMAAGAGAIRVSLGGRAVYHGKWQERPSLGPTTGNRASAESVDQAIGLVNRTLCLWFSVIVVIGILG
ncbi:MAG: cobalamin biosynthesis protein [Gammaproteobacteria bacterium]|nr:MAG: cobalamin biosynthesis protein [Gammaproteobacteria bacterium]